MKKLLFFDIDGTLITDDGRRLFPEDARQAILAARRAGNLTFINTGRVRCNVEPFISDAGFDGLVCGCGSYIEYRSEVLYHHLIPREECIRLAEVCRECHMQSFYEYAYASYYDGSLDMPYIRSLAEYMRQEGRPIIDLRNAGDFRFDKFSGWMDENSDMDRFKREIRGTFTYIDRGEHFFEVEPVGHSKASGISYLLEYFGLNREDVYVFGDGNNDLEMMNFAGHSIAMGNGNENCKAAAEYVTAAVEEGGIQEAIRYFGLE